MATLILVIVVALVALAYVAVPLLVPDQADPLPDFSDPIAQDLAEERDALVRAIKEVEERTDLPDERRQALRARYEAKAAHVLEALDAREAELAGRPPAHEPRRRRVPYGAVAVAALVVVAAAVMPSFVLPRVGREATVTSTDATLARQIQKLQRAADQQPNAKNLMALGDAYWNAQEADKAVAAYQKVIDTITPVPAAVYKRLAAVYLQSDLGKAYGYLQKALTVAPNDPETLYAMGQVAFAQGSLAEAKRAFERYLATPGNANDAQAKQQIAEIDAVQPLAEKAKQDPSESNLMALADAYWAQGDKNRAVNVYIQVLTGPDVHNPVALSRTGQVLFTSGRSADAISLLTRAGEAAGGLDKLDLPSLLMLGNAYFSQQQYQHAIDTWNLDVRKAGGPAKAGRVPDLIASAKA
ncbi:MAG: tetratricopeptide repeat protein, partial [Deinococcales bacterium]